MRKLDGPWPLRGWVVWLTPDQGGRPSRPPDGGDYAQIGFVPPHDVHAGASFVLTGFEPGAWTSRAQGRWLVVANEGDQGVEPGTVVVCAEGRRVVAYFHVEHVLDEP